MDIFAQMTHPPEIPLDFTKEQLEEAKSYAYSRFLETNPDLYDKTLREELHPLNKIKVVNLLSRYFDEKVKLMK